MGTVTEVEITNGLGDDIEVTIKGNPANVVKALVKGIGPEALMKMQEAIEAELRKRRK
jgi:hypothetical protein